MTAIIDFVTIYILLPFVIGSVIMLITLGGMRR